MSLMTAKYWSTSWELALIMKYKEVENKLMT